MSFPAAGLRTEALIANPAPSGRLFSIQIGAEWLETGTTAGAGATSKVVDNKDVQKEVSMNMGDPADHEKNASLRQDSAEDEARRIRRLQVMMSMVTSVISQDPGLTIEEASELAASAKRAALAMFPDKELAYDLLYKPRLQRLMRERFRLQ
jgi:hypothetical protein